MQKKIFQHYFRAGEERGRDLFSVDADDGNLDDDQMADRKWGPNASTRNGARISSSEEKGGGGEEAT